MQTFQPCAQRLAAAATPLKRRPRLLAKSAGCYGLTMGTLRAAALLALGLVLAFGAPRPACADGDEIAIEGGGGIFDITLHPDVLTTLYFPEKVTDIFVTGAKVDKDGTMHVQGFTIQAPRNMTDLILARPDAKAAIGDSVTLNVKTASDLKISINLKVGPKDKAKSQVRFVLREKEEQRKAEIAAEAQRLVADKKKELDDALRDLPNKIDAEAKSQILDRMLAEFSTRSLSAIERTDDNVVVRINRAAVVGADVYLFVDVQNREGLRYVLRSVQVLDGSTEVPTAAVRFQSRAAGVIPKDVLSVVEGQEAHVHGLIVLPHGRVKGRTLSVRFAEDGKKAISLGGVKVD